MFLTFYASADAIFCHTKYVFEYVRLNLIESYALSNSLVAVNLAISQMRHLNVCWNNVYRKTFSMHRWESVKHVQFYSGRLDLIHMLHLCKLNFSGPLLQGTHRNCVISIGLLGKGDGYNLELLS